MDGSRPDAPSCTCASQANADPLRVGDCLERYRDDLKARARQWIGPRLRAKLDASDLVQETFLTAHASAEQFRGVTEAEMKSWLKRILSSRISALVRRFVHARARNVHWERSLIELWSESSGILPIANTQSTPSQHTMRREEAARLMVAMEKLLPEYKTIIVLRHFEQREFAEVARRMERSDRSVRRLWLRALAALEKELRSSRNEPE